MFKVNIMIVAYVILAMEEWCRGLLDGLKEQVYTHLPRPLQTLLFCMAGEVGVLREGGSDLLYVRSSPVGGTSSTLAGAHSFGERLAKVRVLHDIVHLQQCLHTHTHTDTDLRSEQMHVSCRLFPPMPCLHPSHSKFSTLCPQPQ